jgi:hypothetical protein
LGWQVSHARIGVRFDISIRMSGESTVEACVKAAAAVALQAFTVVRERW